ncbi:MAG: zinc ribbon domain-containing protein [Asgard group archaeon]|nr:zinc ribbon domain-containing protein [Asgard group archaeon]
MVLDSENSCPHCGELINHDDAFCSNCGGMIKEEIEVLPSVGFPYESTISAKKLLKIEELVKEKKIVSVKLIATATSLSIEEVISACSELRLRNDGEFIFAPEIVTEEGHVAIKIPPRKPITTGELRKKLVIKRNCWANVGIAFLIIAVILYGVPMPCVSLYGGFPVGVIAIICSFISLFTPRQRKKSIIVFVFSLLATIIWGTQHLLIFG